MKNYLMILLAFVLLSGCCINNKMPRPRMSKIEVKVIDCKLSEGSIIVSFRIKNNYHRQIFLYDSSLLQFSYTSKANLEIISDSLIELRKTKNGWEYESGSGLQVDIPFEVPANEEIIHKYVFSIDMYKFSSLRPMLWGGMGEHFFDNNFQWSSKASTAYYFEVEPYYFDLPKAIKENGWKE